MSCCRIVGFAVFAGLLSAAFLATAQSSDAKPPAEFPAPALVTAHGQVVKADADSITLRPRGADGRFEKELVLQMTSTTKITQLTIVNRGGPVVLQGDADSKSLQPQQEIAVIHAWVGGRWVLLSAVVLPAKK
jgi:hypothetical protein